MASEEFVKQSALAHARAMGCDCEPEIGYTINGAVMHLTIEHDDDCTLMEGNEEETT